MYGEDLDLGCRCRLAGWKALYVPTATVYHGFQASSKKRGERFAVSQVRKNRLRSLLKNGSMYFLGRNLIYVFYDFLVGLKYNGYAAVPNLFSAIHDGLSQRGDVSSIAKIKRRDLEKKWLFNKDHNAR